MKKSYNAFLNFRRELLERNHRCASCPAAFKKIAHLKAHSLRHTGEKPFKCATCDKYVNFLKQFLICKREITRLDITMQLLIQHIFSEIIESCLYFPESFCDNYAIP